MSVSLLRSPATALVLTATLALLVVIISNVQTRFGDSPLTAPNPLEAEARARPSYNYDALRRNIIYGRASLAEVRRALTDSDPAALGNTIHGLYNMRWHRGVMHVLDGMWSLDKEKYPELSWELIAAAPVRIALASTINRIRIVKTGSYQDYIRSHQQDRHEFNRAQVAVALGFNGDPRDLPYLREMADGDNHYVAQSAITALSIFGGNQARDILIQLVEKHGGTPRSDLMKELLRTAYGWPPAP